MLRKNCLLLIRSEKTCTFKLRVEKNIAPHVSNGPPLNGKEYKLLLPSKNPSVNNNNISS